MVMMPFYGSLSFASNIMSKLAEEIGDVDEEIGEVKELVKESLEDSFDIPVRVTRVNYQNEGQVRVQVQPAQEVGDGLEDEFEDINVRVGGSWNINLTVK